MLGVFPLSAQWRVDPPLIAPVLGFDSATQDRIILYDVSGDFTRELQFGNSLHRLWQFSPDGCRILFTLSSSPTSSRVYSARLDGSDLRELIQADTSFGSWSAWEPQWSPDGRQIAFTLIQWDELRGSQQIASHRIAWVPAEGGAVEFVSNSGDEHHPRWSPDGQFLSYVAYEERVPGQNIYSTAEPNVTSDTRLREADLWVRSINDGTRYRLTNFPIGSVGTPAWSPDSDLIGFFFSPSANVMQVWMIGNSPTAIPTQLSYDGVLGLDLTWLPDSTQMLISARNMQNTRENRLWRIPLQGNADVDAQQWTTDMEFRFADFPRFSPDGEWLAARSEYALILEHISTYERLILEGDFIGNTPPVWSPSAFTNEASCS